MTKRVLAGILMLVFVFASAMGVSAADSKTGKPKVDQAQDGYYKVIEGEKEFEEVKESAVLDAIKGFNKGDVKVDKLLEKAPSVLSAVNGKTAVGDIFDLRAINEGKPNANGSHTVTVVVPSLTDKMSGIVLAHYSVQNNAWEIVTPDKVDLANKTITATFKSLSPILIFANVSTDGAAGTSPATGVSSTWMIWTVAALIVFGAGVVVLEKKRR